jgi:hypothetical protein
LKLAKDGIGKMADYIVPDPNLSAPIQFSHAIFIQLGKLQQNLRT